jgi:hypothetical protein
MPVGINMGRRTQQRTGESNVDRPVVISLALAGVLIICVIVYIIFFRGPAEPEPEPVPVPEVVEAEVVPEEVEAGPAAINLPPLDESDGLVRLMAQELSANPRLAATLATDELVRKFVAAVVNISAGETPAAHLGVLGPEGEFHVVPKDGNVVLDPASYRRYDGLAGAFTSLNTAGTVQLYYQLKPLLDVAYRDLGYPDRDFHDALLAAIDQMIATPVIEGDIEVESGVLSYRYRDPDIESLSDVDKHLLRMGPENVGAIQEKLQELRVALAVSR